MKRLGLGVCVALFCAGCVGTEPTPQADIEANAKAEVAKIFQKPIETTYGKVLKNPDDISSLNDCVSSEIVAALNENEKLFLGGDIMDKATLGGDVAKAVGKKLIITSPEAKAAIKSCSISLGMSKLGI